jgi:hypothetical protein
MAGLGRSSLAKPRRLADLGRLGQVAQAKRLTENELIDFSPLCHDGCAH